MKKGKVDLELYKRAMEFQRIGNQAVKEAKEENHRLGLPNVFSVNGHLNL